MLCPRPECAAVVPPSLGRRPRRFCSERCRVLASEERRALRRQLAQLTAEQADLSAAVEAGRCYGGDGRRATPENVASMAGRIAELEGRLAGLEDRACLPTI